MKNMISMGLRFENGVLKILDQTELPQIEKWIVCDTVETMEECIQKLRVRGAPLIGVAAVLMLGKLVAEGLPDKEIQQSAAILRKARPTAVNLMHCIDRFMLALNTEGKSAAIKTAESIYDEDVALCDSMANYGAELITDNQTVMTYCNTGGLATAGVGTALGVIKKAYSQGKKLHVYVNETRPLLQGGRLTTWELAQANIPHTLICDNMAAHLMSVKKIDAIFVGADRIAANGDFANKIGTYNLAVIAKHHNVPFYVVAPYTTIDANCKSGKEIIIEERNPTEIRGVSGNFGQVTWSPTECHVYNPAFDVTPAELVTKYIFDQGVFSGADADRVKSKPYHSPQLL